MPEDSGVIVAGTDLEEGGSEALKQARAWSDRTGAALVACHAVPEPPALDSLLGQLDHTARAALAGVEKRAQTSLKSHVERVLGAAADVTTVVLSGSPHAALIDEADRRRARLVVVGATRKGMAERLLYGSSAKQVVEHAQTSVLVARPSPTSNKVVVATDLSDASLPAIEAAVVEASRRKAELIALSALDLAYPLASGVEPGIVIDEDTTKLLHESCHQALGAAVERFGGKAKTEVVEGPPARAVIAAAERLGAELLVVGTRGRTGLARLALGSVAGRIVSRAHCSVLVVRAR